MRARKKMKWILLVITLLIGIGAGTFYAVISYQMSLIPGMSFDEMMTYTTKDNETAKITVGIIKDGEMTYTVYGNNGEVLPSKEYTYEIGSLTKTFTATLVCKAINEKKIDLNDSIDHFIDLPEKDHYPTLKRLVTHTSGYKAYYLERQMVSNFLHHQENDYYGMNQDVLIKRIGKIQTENRDYDFKYSNFGFATVGTVLSGIYNEDFAKLMNGFLVNDLKLENTKISDGTGDLEGYWDWKPEDAYLSAGAITSTIGDMMQYVELNMSEKLSYLSLGHQVVSKVNATSHQYEKLNIRMDAVGIGWMIDTQNQILWHNGGTSNFNSYAAFDMEHQIGVVILSNCAPNYKIPSTVMGVKLMTNLQKDADK